MNSSDKSNLAVMANLEPAPLWKAFGTLSSIPRCSTKEAAVMKWIKEIAHAHGHSCKSDSAGNLLVRVRGNGQGGFILLQAHTDMVCEKNEGTCHDFDSDPLELQIDGDWICARGTTLGADNGIGVAIMVALMQTWKGNADLGLLFTIDEERGLTGALELDPTLLEASILLNLDGEEEGLFYIGCAGGHETQGTKAIETVPMNPRWIAKTIRVRGLKGGHSGADIHHQRGNSIKLLNRLLLGLKQIPEISDQISLVSLEGGDKHNAIPREARAVVAMAPVAEPIVRKAVESWGTLFAQELNPDEPGISVCVEDADSVPAEMWSLESQASILGILQALPHGVQLMSRTLPGLVSTSSNLASIRTGKRTCSIVTSQRSDRDSLRDELSASLDQIFRAFGFSISHNNPYPAWTPAPQNPLAAAVAQSWKEFSGTEAQLLSIHAGLECGVIGEKKPGISMVSFGPDIKDVHTPQERASISSAARFWKFLNLYLDSWSTI